MPLAVLRLLATALLLATSSPSRAADPITLDQALDLAARRNADLLGARADLDLARADRSAALSGLLPRLDLSATFGHVYQGATTTRTTVVNGVPIPVGGGPEADAASYSAGLRVNQPIFDWALFQDYARSGDALRGQERTYDERALSIAFDVTSRFYDLVKAERSLEVLQKTVARSEELVTRAEALFQAGRAPRSDALTARTNLQADRINVVAQRARVEQARAALAQVLGVTEPETLAVVAPAALDSADLPTGEPPPFETLRARAQERRPGLLADRAFVNAAEAGVSRERAGWMPGLSLQASYNRTGEALSGTDGVYGDPSRAYDASLFAVLSWNLFEGGFTRAQTSRARASLASTEAGAARNVHLVSREIAVARAAVLALTAQGLLARDALAIARDALTLATQRFEAGLASQIEIRDANLKVTQAELTLVQARIDHAVATADLLRAVGGAL